MRVREILASAGLSLLASPKAGKSESSGGVAKSERGTEHSTHGAVGAAS
jgi:hypothetical protein